MGPPPVLVLPSLHAVCFGDTKKCSKFGLVSWSWKNPSRTKSKKRRTPWGDDSGSIWIWISPLVVSHLTRHCRCHLRSFISFVSSRRTKPFSLRDIATMASCFTLAAPVPPHKHNKCNSNAKMKRLWAMTTAEPEKHLSRLRLWRNKSSGKNRKLKWSLLMNFQILNLNVSGYKLLWLFDMTWFDILRYSVEASWFPSRVPLGVLPTRREDDHRLSKIHAWNRREFDSKIFYQSTSSNIKGTFKKYSYYLNASFVELRDVLTNVRSSQCKNSVW